MSTFKGLNSLNVGHITHHTKYSNIKPQPLNSPMSVITVQKHLLHEYKLPESSQNINLSNEIQVAVFDNFDLTTPLFLRAHSFSLSPLSSFLHLN